VLLTNGVGWTLFHLTFKEGINYDVAFDIDLIEDEIGSVTQHLSLIHRKSIAAGQLNDFWAHRSALSPSSLSKALFHEDTLRVLRRTLRNNSGIRITEDEVAKSVYGILSLESKESIGKMKIIRKKKVKTEQQVAAGGPLPTEVNTLV